MEIYSIAKEVVNEYAEGFTHVMGVEYANRALFISLDENFNAIPSVSSTILSETYQAAIILVRSEIAISNSYWWYDIRFINHLGRVYNEFNIDDWSIVTFCDGKYSNQKIALKYKDRVIIKRDLNSKEWSNNVKEIFDYFSLLKTATTEEEQKWMIKYLDSKSENEKLISRNLLLDKKLSFLENQVTKYTDILNRLEFIIKETDSMKE